MASVEEVTRDVLGPMQALFRAPYGIENPAEALTHYVRRLVQYPPEALRAGWQRIEDTYRKRDWPTIADLLDAIEPEREGDDKLGALRKADSLRRNATWAAWLDGLHPVAEHHFFANANIGAQAHRISNLTPFEATYVRQKYSESLRAAFGCYVAVDGDRAPPKDYHRAED